MSRYYDIIKVLGRGSYGQALLVKMKAGPNNKQVSVVKVSINHPVDGIDNENVKEICILKGLVHDNIVKLKSVFTDRSNFVMELERMDGIMDNSGVDLNDFKDRLNQICIGLKHMHLSGFTHNDLKPPNILERKGRIKLADFGICRFHGLPQLRDMGHCDGTAMYVSPECSGTYATQMRAYRAREDRRIDTGTGAAAAAGAGATCAGAGMACMTGMTGVAAGAITTENDRDMPLIESLLSDCWGVGVFIYDYVYSQIHGKNSFPWDWKDVGIIYNLQYEEGNDLPVGVEERISRSTGDKYYIFQMLDGEPIENSDRRYASFVAPLRVSEIISVIGEDGFDLLKGCMEPNVNKRLSILEILEHSWFSSRDEPADIELFPQQQQQQQGGKPSILRPSNMINFKAGRNVNNLKYLEASRQFVKAHTAPVVISRSNNMTCNNAAIIASWINEVNVAQGIIGLPEITMMTGFLFNSYFNAVSDVTSDDYQKVVVAAFFLAANIYSNGITIDDMVYYTARVYTGLEIGECAVDIVSKVVLDDESGYSIVPKLQYLSIYLLDYINTVSDLPLHFMEHCYDIAIYMAFCSDETITSQDTFTRTVIASAMVDFELGADSGLWMFATGNYRDFVKHTTETRSDKFTTRLSEIRARKERQEAERIAYVSAERDEAERKQRANAALMKRQEDARNERQEHERQESLMMERRRAERKIKQKAAREARLLKIKEASERRIRQAVERRMRQDTDRRMRQEALHTSDDLQ